MTISSTTRDDNDFTSILQFSYLEEGQEGTYSCRVRILEAAASELVELSNIAGKPMESFVCT